MNIKDLQKPLPIESIDFRVQSINKGGYATILAYKDARVDINRLNEVCGQLGWKREHTRDNKNCIVSIWDAKNKHWVSKEDTGTESYTEAQKGLASDSFKRSCFNWGIGIELYDYPVIQVKLNDNEWRMDGDKPKATWHLRIKEWHWEGKFENDKLVFLSAKDEKGVTRFTFPENKNNETSKTPDKGVKVDRWLTDKEFNIAKDAEPVQIRNLLKKYNQTPQKDGKVYGMKKEYRTELQKLVKNGKA